MQETDPHFEALLVYLRSEVLASYGDREIQDVAPNLVFADPPSAGAVGVTGLDELRNEAFAASPLARLVLTSDGLVARSNRQLEKLFGASSRARRLQDDLENANQQLEAAYEELQSTNDELQSINDQLRVSTGRLDEANASSRRSSPASRRASPWSTPTCASACGTGTPRTSGACAPGRSSSTRSTGAGGRSPCGRRAPRCATATVVREGTTGPSS